MKRLLRPLLVPLLRRRADEVERVASAFAISEPHSRDLVRQLGRAFIGGYNTMLEAASLAEVHRRGCDETPHWRPFFFEGAAMGYLPRTLFANDVARDRAASDLLALDPAYRYLYYVGLGFWYGFRYPRHPERIEQLSRAVDAFHLPLCWDGWGFKRGFFDHADADELPRLAARCPPAVRAQVWQGFGRATFFRAMDRPESFHELIRPAGAEHRSDAEFGRALAVAFTGVDRPLRIAEFVASAGDAEELGARLTGVSWALTARRMNDADYFRTCLAGASREVRGWLAALPDCCESTREAAASYADWQVRTRRAALSSYAAAPASPPASA